MTCELQIKSLPKCPGVPCSYANWADYGRRAGRASFRWAAWCRDCDSPSLVGREETRWRVFTPAVRSVNRCGRQERFFSCTYAPIQVATVADVREAEHLFPPPAATFDPSICRRPRRKTTSLSFISESLVCPWLTFSRSICVAVVEVKTVPTRLQSNAAAQVTHSGMRCPTRQVFFLFLTQ